MTDTLAKLSAEGVAIWLDDLSRHRLAGDSSAPGAADDGNLAALARDRHVVGVTTNPTIFQKAISSSALYDAQVRDLAARGVDVGEALRSITAFDVRWACDVLRPTYEATGRLDGRVSIEVDPRLAHETKRTIAEARALWWLVDRPNVFIKIPATAEGVPAISQALAEGINVNVTLIFSLRRYGEVMDAFFTGMEQAKANGHDLSTIASVASFFVSRVDTEVDKRLDKLDRPEAARLRGKAAIANTRLAYRDYERAFDSDRWRALADAGAKPQRPLWASTSVKDPAYDDTRYVVDLVAPGIVNTMPQSTMQAVADHGTVAGDTIHGTYEQSQEVIDQLASLGIDYDDVVGLLEREGVEKFEASWAELADSIGAELSKKAGR